jgi:hypothetical protein
VYVLWRQGTWPVAWFRPLLYGIASEGSCLVSSRKQQAAVPMKCAGGPLSPNFTLRDSPRPTSCGFCSVIGQWPLPVMTETGAEMHAYEQFPVRCLVFMRPLKLGWKLKVKISLAIRSRRLIKRLLKEIGHYFIFKIRSRGGSSEPINWR